MDITTLTSSLHGIEVELRRVCNARAAAETKKVMRSVQVDCHQLQIRDECARELQALERAMARALGAKLLKAAIRRSVEPARVALNEEVAALRRPVEPQDGR